MHGANAPGTTVEHDWISRLYQYLKEYAPENDATPHELLYEQFLDEPWMVRLMMAAEDRLERNSNTMCVITFERPLHVQFS